MSGYSTVCDLNSFWCNDTDKDNLFVAPFEEVFNQLQHLSVQIDPLSSC